MTRVSFRVHIDTPTSGFDVSIVSVNEHGVAQDFAKVNAKDLGTALTMAVPYMLSVAQPDPFAAVLADATSRATKENER